MRSPPLNQRSSRRVCLHLLFVDAVKPAVKNAGRFSQIARFACSLVHLSLRAHR